MKIILSSAFALLIVACNESNPDHRDNASSYEVNALDPYKDLNPEIDSGTQSAPPQSTEKWYGLDSDEDTVIYEQDGKILMHGYVTGTFERIDRGDFMHYVLRDSNGFLHSFFIYLDNQRQMDKYYEGYEPARGHPVTVKWIRGPLRVSDGGAMETVYQAKEITE